MKNLNELPLIKFRISLHCPAPTRKRKDKEEQLTASAGAESGTIRVQQERIPAKWQKPISAIQSKVRKHFDDNAFRINDCYAIPVAQFEAFEASYQHLLQQHEGYLSALCMAIESGEIVEEAKRRMGDDFDPSFLPKSCEAVRNAIRINIRTIADLSSPVIAQALSQLADDTVIEVTERIKQDQAKLEAEGQANVVSFVMDEIVEYLKDIQTRVGAGEKGAHFKTVLDKFTRITQKLPAYNVTENPTIANAIERIYETFKTLDKDTLKENATYRQETVASATEILKDLETENLF
jgi:hypothetical protein